MVLDRGGVVGRSFNFMCCLLNLNRQILTYCCCFFIVDKNSFPAHVSTNCVPSHRRLQSNRPPSHITRTTMYILKKRRSRASQAVLCMHKKTWRHLMKPSHSSSDFKKNKQTVKYITCTDWLKWLRIECISLGLLLHKCNFLFWKQERPQGLICSGLFQLISHSSWSRVSLAGFLPCFFLLCRQDTMHNATKQDEC